MRRQLYLASGSLARRTLLEQARIPFTLISHHANEQLCVLEPSLVESVEKLAQFKMNHSILPLVNGQTELFVLTADTLTQDISGKIFGKPKDKTDAVHMIRLLRTGSRIATGACLRVYEAVNEQWILKNEVVLGVESTCVFDVPDECIEDYLNNIDWRSCAGAIQIEGYGFRYLKWIEGSYTAILGLPLYEITAELSRFGFFEETSK